MLRMFLCLKWCRYKGDVREKGKGLNAKVV